jgi:hypothetical protein
MKKLASIMLGGLTTLTSAQAANIAWVSFHPGDNTPSAAAASAGFTTAPDKGYTDLLQANGHTVTRFLSSDIPNAALNTYGLVIISRSVPSGHYELDAETAAWNAITAPTMILGGYIIRNTRLGYSTGATIPDTTTSITLSVSNPSHPIFAGVSLDSNNTTVNTFANIVSYTNSPQRGISVVTSPMSSAGTILARVGNTNDAAAGGMIIGEWQAGSMMSNSPPDTLGGKRLVFLTGSRENGGLTAEGAGIYDLTTDGSRMFLNAVGYMAVPEPSTVALLVLGGAALLFRFRKR